MKFNMQESVPTTKKLSESAFARLEKAFAPAPEKDPKDIVIEKMNKVMAGLGRQVDIANTVGIDEEYKAKLLKVAKNLKSIDIDGDLDLADKKVTALLNFLNLN